MVPAGYTEEEVERAICEALDAAEIEDMATSEIAALCALATLPTREAMRAEIERLTKIIDNHNADAAARGGDRIRFPLAAAMDR